MSKQQIHEHPPAGAAAQTSNQTNPAYQDLGRRVAERDIGAMARPGDGITRTVHPDLEPRDGPAPTPTPGGPMPPANLGRR